MIKSKLVQRQLDAYNKRDLEEFCSCDSPTVQVLSFPSGTPKEDFLHQTFEMRYQKLFEQSPDLKCELISRIVKGNFVIDEEYVIGMYGKSEPIHAVVIYEVSNRWIERVWFM